MTALGEFNPDLEFYQAEDWIVFFLCSLFNIIVLLNLLIAIVSETFANYTGALTIISYKELVKQIEDMQNSLYGNKWIKASFQHA